MCDKLSDGSELYDHEVLEILLFAACPRVNTNPVAHALLNRFVTLSEVFCASVEELTEVVGVGESTANFIRTVGMCAERAGRIGNAPTLKTGGDCKRFVDLRLRGKSEEYIELYFLDKAGRVKRIYTYTSGERSRASAKIDDVAKAVVFSRPDSVIIAHNHIDGTLNPSDYDDEFTALVQFVCNINKVRLADHYVYLSRDETFSYRDAGRLEKLKDNCNLEKFGKWIKTLN